MMGRADAILFGWDNNVLDNEVDGCLKKQLEIGIFCMENSSSKQISQATSFSEAAISLMENNVDSKLAINKQSKEYLYLRRV